MLGCQPLEKRNPPRGGIKSRMPEQRHRFSSYLGALLIQGFLARYKRIDLPDETATIGVTFTPLSPNPQS